MQVFYQNLAITHFGGIYRGIGQSFKHTIEKLKFDKTLVSPVYTPESLNYRREIKDLQVIQGYIPYESYDRLKCEYNENPIDYFIGDEKAVLHIWDNFPTGSKLKKVVTVHDMFWVMRKYQYLYGHTLADEKVFRRLFDEIDWIACPSHFSLQDFMEFHPKFTGGTSVIPWGSKYPIYMREGSKVGDYFLYVSCPERRKNFPFLLDAYKKASIKIPLRVVANIDELWPDMKEEIAPLMKDKLITFVGSQISDEQLCKEYRGARALIFPSVFEGFGMPVVEAASQGCPVICSNTSSLREFRGFTWQFNPYSTDELVSVLEKAVRSPEKLLPFRGMGYKALNDYSYQRAACTYKEIYLHLYT